MSLKLTFQFGYQLNCSQKGIALKGPFGQTKPLISRFLGENQLNFKFYGRFSFFENYALT
jgi:hypothetical protein